MSASISAPMSEKAVLSTCLNKIDEGVIGHVARAGGSSPESLFFDHRSKIVFETMWSMVSTGKEPTFAGIVDRIDDMGLPSFDEGAEGYLTNVQLTPPLPTIGQLDSALADLVKHRTIRKQHKSLEELIEDISDDSIDVEPSDVAKRLALISEDTDIASDTLTFGEIAQSIIDMESPAWSISSLVPELDEVLGEGGFESGCLTIIAARPKVGKTIFMNSMIHSVLIQGGVPVVLNYETKKVEFMAKMIAGFITDEYDDMESLHWGKIKTHLMKRDQEFGITRSEISAINKGLEWAVDQDWYVSFDKTMNMQDIHALIARARAENPEDTKIVLFVDYLQLQVQDSMHEREEITDLTRFYKRVAGEFDIPVVCLSQLNRGGDDGEPKPSHMRGSGSIEQDADTILLLDRPWNRDKSELKGKVIVDGTTTRLSSGEKFPVFSDGAVNRVAAWTEELEEAMRQKQESSDDGIFGEKIVAEKSR